MLYIGIDFSMNSTAVCIQRDDSEEEFYSIHRIGFRKKDLPFYAKSGINFTQLEKFNAYDKEVKKKNHEMEYDKLDKAVAMCDIIINLIDKYDEDFHVSIEGFSYNGIGKRSFDLAGFQYVLRSILFKDKRMKSIYVFTPTEIKKFAVKGNATKGDMIDMFGTIIDAKNPVSKLLKENQEHFKMYPKPIDDLVDSYYAKEMLKHVLKEKEC